MGRRPMCFWIAIGLFSLSSKKSRAGSLTSTGLPSRISNCSLPVLPMTCSGGMPYTRSAKARMKSLPPPETMYVLNPLARRKARSSSIGW